MAVTATKTAREIVKSAMRLGRVTDLHTEPEAVETKIVLEALNDMIKAWQNKGWHVWTKASGTLTLTTGAVYTLDPVRPMAILNARIWNGSTELPMTELQREDYDLLPVKTSTGLPTQFYYDRQREAATLTIWPVLAAANGHEIRYTYEREFEDLTALSQVVDVPAEYYEALRYNLAVRACEELAKDPPARVEVRARELLEEAEGFDHEGAVFFSAEGRYHL